VCSVFQFDFILEKLSFISPPADTGSKMQKRIVFKIPVRLNENKCVFIVNEQREQVLTVRYVIC
jgi:hypothetical protein